MLPPNGKRALKIAIVTDTYHPQVNGVVTSVALIKGELERRGHTVFVLCPAYGGRERSEERVHRYASIPYPNRQMAEQRHSATWSSDPFPWRCGTVDLIHSQVPGAMGSHALLWARRYRVPHVHTFHTHYIEYVHYIGFMPGFFRRMVKWRARTFCNRCEAVVAPSTEIRDALLSYGVSVPIDVIPTGIDPATMPASARG